MCNISVAVARMREVRPELGPPWGAAIAIRDDSSVADDLLFEYSVDGKSECFQNGVAVFY